MPAGRPKTAVLTKAEQARAGKARKRAQQGQSDCDGLRLESRESAGLQESDEGSDSDGDYEEDICHWDGSVNVPFDADSESDWIDEEGEDVDADEENDTGYDLEGDELRESLRMQVEAEINQLQMLRNVNLCLDGRNITRKQWEKAEKNRGLGYNGLSKRSAQYRAQKAREKEEIDKQTRSSQAAQAFRSFFAQSKTSVHSDSATSVSPQTSMTAISEDDVILDDHPSQLFCGYDSDLSEDEAMPEDGWETDEDEFAMTAGDSATPETSESISEMFHVQLPPPLKRRRHEIPIRVQRQQERARRKEEIFDAGANGLQAYRARAIQSYLTMVVKNGRKGVDTSERAAESQGFAAKWGGRLVRSWVKKWIATRTLPVSKRGQHIKVFTLLNDPTIRDEMRAFLRSNKWTMNPQKLADFTQNKLLPDEAKKYAKEVLDKEMPTGLKNYLEIELFPRVHQKVNRGISLQTARRWLRAEGFQYTEFKKGLYYDGHERPDVVEDRQDRFLPNMSILRPRLVEYVVGSVLEQVKKQPESIFERQLVLLSHDEMTAQANDGKGKGWILEGEQPLRKKGVGRGLHQSDVICSTFGWLAGASQTLEYGKNYDGYWTGELFVKQLREKIIPEFERLHGQGFQALIMVDNSQGHSAYSKDALLTSRMNMNPGGKQARMHDGWFMSNGRRVSQPMIFPADHPEFPDAPKGMKHVLMERGLWKHGLRMQCPDKCASDASDCCAKRILSLQPDFMAQKSLVQEVIEEHGHMCIFLPKFHCELNFIEYFWGAVKKYLRDNCDYTFETLKENMPKALASVPVERIRKWEHRMYRWMDAYRTGLGAKDAQAKVKQFSSRRYTFHRRVPETLARQFDQ